MRHNVKTRVFRILDLFPNRLGYLLYHFLQNVGSKMTVEQKINSTKNTYETISKILNHNNIDIKDSKIAELGSGWVPIFPYQLILEGKVKSVDTYDINEHYNVTEIKKLNDYYQNKYSFEIKNKTKYSLLEGVTYFPMTNICSGNVNDVDLVLSRFVLEHVPPKDIIEMHDFLFSNLKQGSHVLHLISPSDHRAYSDSSLSLHDFLKYSEEEWNQIQTKFDYHNRLRLPQYLQLLNNNFEIVYFEHDHLKVESESFKKFKKLKIHKDFEGYSDQELMAGSINILLKKK